MQGNDDKWVIIACYVLTSLFIIFYLLFISKMIKPRQYDAYTIEERIASESLISPR